MILILIPILILIIFLSRELLVGWCAVSSVGPIFILTRIRILYPYKDKDKRSVGVPFHQSGWQPDKGLGGKPLLRSTHFLSHALYHIYHMLTLHAFHHNHMLFITYTYHMLTLHLNTHYHRLSLHAFNHAFYCILTNVFDHILLHAFYHNHMLFIAF